MGNVQASSPPSSPLSGTPPPSPPLTAPPPPSAKTPEKIIPTPTIGNPGTFEELHKKCKGEPNIYYWWISIQSPSCTKLAVVNVLIKTHCTVKIYGNTLWIHCVTTAYLICTQVYCACRITYFITKNHQFVCINRYRFLSVVDFIEYSNKYIHHIVNR
jgi:hypothetical protein